MAKGRKTGGRQKGTPNKNNTLKQCLRMHSERYFKPTLVVNNTLAEVLTPPEAETKLTAYQLAAKLGCQIGDMVSRYDIDSLGLPASVRVDAEIKLLNYTEAKIQATTIDMNMTDDATRQLEEKLAYLASTNEN